jgi:cold-inducible RNA-binding protein
MKAAARDMRAPRRLLRGPRWIRRSTDAPSHGAPLPGYLCEQCQDAPAVQWQPAPEGGEIGVCEDCISAGERMNIFVGNLAFTTTEAEVRQLFEGYGMVDTVRLLTDRETGQPRGFGFVEMRNGTEARAAIAGLHGKDVGGRSLTVNEARPREERGGPRRGPQW